MVSDHQEHAENRVSYRALWIELAWTAPIALFAVAVFSLPFGEEGSEVWIGIIVAAYLFGSSVFDHFWPSTKANLSAKGAPEWLFEKGWRSNAVTSGFLALALFLLSLKFQNRASWFSEMPLLIQFIAMFGLIFVINAIGKLVKTRFGVS